MKIPTKKPWRRPRTYPEDDVVAEEQVLVPAADLGIRVSIIVHLLRGGTCGGQ